MLRPLNVLLILGSVFVGGWVAVPEGATASDWLRLMAIAFSAAFIGSGGNVINDYFDVEIDRINRPHRPLPSGLVPVHWARNVWMITTLSGVLIGFSISSWKHGLTSILVSLALYIYSRWFKQLPFLGNFWVALISGVAIMYGGATFGWGFEAIWAALFAFGVTLSREITKDIEDMAGDAALGAKTLPIRFGRGTAVFLGSLMMALTILMTPLPYWWNAYGGLYLMVVGVADVLMLRAIWLLATDRETGAHQSSAYLKMAVVVGLIALLLP